MTGEKITAVDVAMRAGVSRSAVSRVFTPGASVSARTAEKVRVAAAELGYRPNVLARSLITGRSRIIGLVVAYLENYFYPEALEKLSNRLQAEGYHVLIFMAAQEAEDLDRVVEEILDYQVDGIIAASVALSSNLTSRCRHAGVPVVLFNRIDDMEAVASVASDNIAGGREVARFLLAGGHHRLAYIAGWEDASTQRDREAGFRQELNAAGMDLVARGIGNFRAEDARDAARAMFDCPAEERPDAVFVCNDHMAFAVLDVLREELGLRVPHDVSVVGYDDVPPAAWGAYALTTIRQHANVMVESTVRILLNQITAPDAPLEQVKVPGPLVVRRTARIPDGWITSASPSHSKRTEG